MSNESPYTILVVDDNPVIRDLVSTDLEQHGYRALAAEDGIVALQALKAEPVDLMLLDVVMPVLNGFEVLQTLRRHHSAGELPVIMATARDDSMDVVRAFDLGANDYVTKPLDLPVVRARIQAQLRARRPAVSAAGETPARIRPGAEIEGRFRLEALLGRGSYGVVYRATDLKLEREVAIKLLHAGFQADDTAQRRFQREGISACRLQHRNAVAVLDFSFTAEGSPYLVMELLQGETLADELRRAGKLSLARCAEIVTPLCDVLAAAHEAGIIHRDVKPQNVFLHQGSEGEIVKMVDFGLAKLMGDAALRERVTLEDGSPGTPAYMAPERFSQGSYDGRTDVYSLGVLTFEMLTGRLPFEEIGSNPMRMIVQHVTGQPKRLRELDPALPEAVDDLLAQALVKDFHQRPSAAEFGARFAAVAAAAGDAGG
ncbi:MAG: response regulator [Acidobacteria bacterium]|nr:MAG: response regulator [Acidobacteriota bacterium]